MTMTKTEIERLAILETKVDNIRDSVDNHIPTALALLDAKIDKINLRLAYATGVITVILAAIQLAINKWG